MFQWSKDLILSKDFKSLFISMVQYKLILESNLMKGEYFDRIDDLNKFT